MIEAIHGELPRFVLSGLAQPAWSPDGTRLAVSAYAPFYWSGSTPPNAHFRFKVYERGGGGQALMGLSAMESSMPSSGGSWSLIFWRSLLLDRIYNLLRWAAAQPQTSPTPTPTPTATPTTCTVTTNAGVNLHSGPHIGDPIVDSLASNTTVVVIGQNIGESYVGTNIWYLISSPTFGWAHGSLLNLVTACASVPTVGDSGTPTPTPPPPTPGSNECYASTIMTVRVYKQGEKDTENRIMTMTDELAAITNDTTLFESLGTSLPPYYLVVASKIHITGQYIFIRYTDSTGTEQSGLAALDSLYIPQSCMSNLSQMVESELPYCESDQFVNCVPKTECSSIFGCSEDSVPAFQIFTLASFGSLTPPGCSNATCDANPCKEWPIKDQKQENPDGSETTLKADERHCGEDLQTKTVDGTIGRNSGPVYSIQDGLFCDHTTIPEGSIFKIRSIMGDEVWEYQYTHISPYETTPDDAQPGSYVASGVYFGTYGEYGQTNRNDLHLHLVNKVYRYIAGVNPCNNSLQVVKPAEPCPPVDDPRDDCPSDPYRRVDVS